MAEGIQHERAHAAIRFGALNRSDDRASIAWAVSRIEEILRCLVLR
jgi:hypothetical protein